MNFRMEISYFLGIMTQRIETKVYTCNMRYIRIVHYYYYYPLLRSLPPSPRFSFLGMGGFNMTDGYCLAFTGRSLGCRPYLLLFVRLHSGT